MRHELNPRLLAEDERLVPGMWVIVDQRRLGNLTDAAIGFVHDHYEGVPDTFEIWMKGDAKLHAATSLDVACVLADPPVHPFKPGDRVCRRPIDRDARVFTVTDRYYYLPGGYTYWLACEDGSSYGGVGAQFLVAAPTPVNS